MLVYLKFLSMFRYVLKYRSMCIWQLRTMIVVMRGSFKLGLKLHAHWLIDGLTDWMTDRLTDSTYSIAARSISQAIRTANMCTCTAISMCECVCVCGDIYVFYRLCMYLQHRHDLGSETSEARISDCTMIIEAYDEQSRQRDREGERQAGRGVDWETERQWSRRRDRGRDKQSRQADRETDKQTDRQTDKQTDRCIKIEIVRLSVRQMDRQTDGQTDEQTDRWTDRRTVGLRDRGGWGRLHREQSNENAKSLNSETQRNATQRDATRRN